MIIKETIEVRGDAHIAASYRAKVIATGVQSGSLGDTLVVWVDEPLLDERIGSLTVTSVFTGDDAPDDARHIGTVQNHGIVVHVYEQNRIDL